MGEAARIEHALRWPGRLGVVQQLRTCADDDCIPPGASAHAVLFACTYTQIARSGASFRTCRTVCRRWSRRTVRHWCGHGSRIADGMCDLTGVRLHPRSPTPMCRRCYTTGSGALSARIVCCLSDLSTGIGKHFHMTRKPRRSATEACSSVRRRFSRRVSTRKVCLFTRLCSHRGVNQTVAATRPRGCRGPVHYIKGKSSC